MPTLLEHAGRSTLRSKVTVTTVPSRVVAVAHINANIKKPFRDVPILASWNAENGAVKVIRSPRLIMSEVHNENAKRGTTSTGTAH